MSTTIVRKIQNLLGVVLILTLALSLSAFRKATLDGNLATQDAAKRLSACELANNPTVWLDAGAGFAELAQGSLEPALEADPTVWMDAGAGFAELALRSSQPAFEANPSVWMDAGAGFGARAHTTAAADSGVCALE